MSFAELLAFNRMRLKLSKKELAEKLGISPAMISKYESGQNFPGAEILSMLADLFGISVDEFYVSRIESQREDLITITNEDLEISVTLSRSELLKLRLNPSDLLLTLTPSNGMSPTINPNDLVLVDRKQKKILDGEVYLLKIGNDEAFFRAYKTIDGDIRLMKDNQRFSMLDHSIQESELDIIGRAVWRSGFISNSNNY